MKAYNREAFWKIRDNWQSIGSTVTGLDGLRAIYEPPADEVSLILYHNTAKGFQAAKVVIAAI